MGAMIEEMSVHEEMISVHEFKNVLDEVVGKIVMKKAGIVGKLKTAKQNLIGHNGEESGRESQKQDFCICDENEFDRRGSGDCNSRSRFPTGRTWCFLMPFSTCPDEVAS